MRALLATIVVGLLASCSSTPPPVATGSESRPVCGDLRFAQWLDDEPDGCAPRNARWMALRDADLQCETDADCVTLHYDRVACASVAVAGSARQDVASLPPPCWGVSEEPFSSIAGACGDPFATCEDGCCVAY